MDIENDLDLQRQIAGTVYTWDEEDRFYRDAIIQIKNKKPRIYIYNRKIVEKIQEDFPDLKIIKREFYWEVINNVSKNYTRKKGRPTKKQNNNS